MIIIGSRAFSEYFGVAPTTEQDHDFISYNDEWNEYMARMKGKEIPAPKGVRAFVVDDGKYKCCYHEAYIAQEGDSNDLILKLYKGIDYAPMSLLLALKLSHRYKKNTPHFIKTMKHIHQFRDIGIELTDVDKEIMELRQKEVLSYGHPNLNVDKKSFFVDDIYKYDHDTIHETVAILNRPAYTFYMKDGQDVMVDREKFDVLAHEVKIYGVYEEACVLALERSQIPNDGNVNPHVSFTMALEKVCTSITSGWFREFAWEHYCEVIELYDLLNRLNLGYVSQFHKNSHMLKPHKG